MVILKLIFPFTWSLIFVCFCLARSDLSDTSCSTNEELLFGSPVFPRGSGRVSFLGDCPADLMENKDTQGAGELGRAK